MDHEMPPMDRTFITIAIRDGEAPEIDLGLIDPTFALQVFRSAARILESLIVQPTIILDNQVIFEDGGESIFFTDDEEE